MESSIYFRKNSFIGPILQISAKKILVIIDPFRSPQTVTDCPALFIHTTQRIVSLIHVFKLILSKIIKFTNLLGWDNSNCWERLLIDKLRSSAPHTCLIGNSFLFYFEELFVLLCKENDYKTELFCKNKKETGHDVLANAQNNKLCHHALNIVAT